VANTYEAAREKQQADESAYTDAKRHYEQLKKDYANISGGAASRRDTDKPAKAR